MVSMEEVVGLEFCVRASVISTETCNKHPCWAGHERWRETTLTEVNRRPGSPNLERHEISSRPRGITVPGGCATGNVGTLMGERMYIYCRMAWGCMSAIEPENNCCRACVPSFEG